MKRSPALLLLAAVALVGLTVRLGLWQLDRAAQKIQRQDSILLRQGLPSLPPGELARSAAGLDLQVHRPIELEGRWAAEHTVYLDNRAMNAHAGFYVVTPLLLPDGTAVLVQRGWLPRDPLDRTRVEPRPTGQGLVRVQGRIAPPPARLFEFDGAASGPIRQNLDPEAFALETRLRLRPLSILQLQPSQSLDGPVADGLLRDWPQPAADVHKHYGYAFQWFALAALTLALYVWFQILRPWRKRSA